MSFFNRKGSKKPFLSLKVLVEVCVSELDSRLPARWQGYLRSFYYRYNLPDRYLDLIIWYESRTTAQLSLLGGAGFSGLYLAWCMFKTKLKLSREARHLSRNIDFELGKYNQNYSFSPPPSHEGYSGGLSCSYYSSSGPVANSTSGQYTLSVFMDMVCLPFGNVAWQKCVLEDLLKKCSDGFTHRYVAQFDGVDLCLNLAKKQELRTSAAFILAKLSSVNTEVARRICALADDSVLIDLALIKGTHLRLFDSSSDPYVREILKPALDGSGGLDDGDDMELDGNYHRNTNKKDGHGDSVGQQSGQRESVGVVRDGSSSGSTRSSPIGEENAAGFENLRITIFNNHRKIWYLLSTLKLPAEPLLRHVVATAAEKLNWSLLRYTEEEGQFQFDDESLTGVVQTATHPEDAMLEMYSLKALALLLTNQENQERFVKSGGLKLLQSMLKIRKDDVHIRRETIRVVANVAVHPNTKHALVTSGWLNLLSFFLRSSDLVVQGQASRALSNMRNSEVELDTDTPSWSSGFGASASTRRVRGVGSSSTDDPMLDSGGEDPSDDDKELYSEGIFLYHPQHLLNTWEQDVDIVFVHGLLGGPFFTWRETVTPESEAKADHELTHCWPKAWLAEDIPNSRILAVEYDSYLTEYLPICPDLEAEKSRRSLTQRASILLQKLKMASIGVNRPILFVTHSMGGLLVKQMLYDASKKEEYSDIFFNTRGIVFFSTPHRGSKLADIGNRIKAVYKPSIEVQELQMDSPALENLNEEFSHFEHIECLSFGESQATEIFSYLSTLIVPSYSSNPGYGRFVLVDVDHMNICKFQGRVDGRYLALSEFLIERIEAWKKEVEEDDEEEENGTGEHRS
eukprot:Nk52_evm4s136 gene=Nk52_evmTU4s136